MDYSVIMAVRNRKAQLAVTLPRVLEQDPPELVIVDDGSTDGLEEFIRAQVPPEILVWERIEQGAYRKNPGPTWNRAAELAHGDVLIHQCPEVYSHSPCSYRALVTRANEHPECVILARVFNSSIHSIPNLPPPRELVGKEWECRRGAHRLTLVNVTGMDVYCGAERPAALIFWGAMTAAFWRKTGGYDDQKAGGADGRYSHTVKAAGGGFIGLGNVIGIHISHGRN